MSSEAAPSPPPPHPLLQAVVSSEAAPSQACVLCLGHNRGWEEAASELAGRAVRLGNSHAALLLGAGASWAAAFEPPVARWELVGVLAPAL